MKKHVISFMVMSGLLISTTGLQGAAYFTKAKEAAGPAAQTASQFLSDFFARLSDAVQQGNTERATQIIDAAKSQARSIGGLALLAVIAGVAVAVKKWIQSPQGQLRLEGAQATAQKLFAETTEQIFEKYGIELTDPIRVLVNANDLTVLFRSQPQWRDVYQELMDQDKFPQALSEARKAVGKTKHTTLSTLPAVVR